MKVLIHFILFSFLIVVLSLTSCKTKYYQVTTIDSNHVDKSFNFSDDIISLDFDFWSYGGKLDFTITNISNNPIFIDWEHSNFIFNGYSYDYYQGRKTIESLGIYSENSMTNFINSNYSLIPYSETSGLSMETATVYTERKVVQIPPNSYINTKPINLDFPSFCQGRHLINQEFNKQNSILNIRLYLAYSNDNKLDSVQYKNIEFWVANIRDVSKKNFKNEVKRNNMFYTKYPKPDMYKTIAFISSLGLVYLVALIAS
ncbi:MAG: hypothetical protein PHF99_12205 [Bacteroidales bacterium]|nr:hypothetical protein [Bacteroidales bacterium]MDD4236768.1 hypothetical protein [Bacteroidales bacterium]